MSNYAKLIGETFFSTTNQTNFYSVPFSLCNSSSDTQVRQYSSSLARDLGYHLSGRSIFVKMTIKMELRLQRNKVSWKVVLINVTSQLSSFAQPKLNIRKPTHFPRGAGRTLPLRHKTDNTCYLVFRYIMSQSQES